MSNLSIFCLVALIAFPLGYGIFLTTQFENLTNASIKDKHAEFYTQLKLRNGRMVVLQPIWFLTRRLLLAIIVVFLGSTVIWQIALMTMTVITQVIILGRVAPFTLPNKTRFEMFSEGIVMLVMYHLICFTPFVPEVEMRFKLGYLVCASVCIHLLVSITILLTATYRDLRIKYFIRSAGKLHNKQRKVLQERLKKKRPVREKKLKARKRAV